MTTTATTSTCPYPLCRTDPFITRSLLDQSPFSFQPQNFIPSHMFVRSPSICAFPTSSIGTCRQGTRLNAPPGYDSRFKAHISFLSECLLEKKLILHWTQLQLGRTSCRRRRRHPTLETAHHFFPELDFVAGASG